MQRVEAGINVLGDAERANELDALLTRVINRRATVEQWMFDAANGKRPMPTPDELREWALHLGTPLAVGVGVPPNRERLSEGGNSDE